MKDEHEYHEATGIGGAEPEPPQGEGWELVEKETLPQRHADRPATIVYRWRRKK